MVTKLSIFKNKFHSKEWLTVITKKAITDGYIQIIEDVSYGTGIDKNSIKVLLQKHGVKDIRFRNVQREKPEPQKEIKGNAKTFRDFFLGKHPDCDVKRLGIAGEKASVKLDRLFQTMADYMDYLMERNEQ